MKKVIDLIVDEQSYIKSMFEDKDKDALELYTYWKYIFRSPSTSMYSRLFGLCDLLDVKHIYDIGCGCSLQALMLVATDMSYLGIDSHIDAVKMNSYFAEGFSQKIKFLCESYPFDLEIKPSSAAIITGVLYEEQAKTKLQEFIHGLMKDFDRIITNFGLLNLHKDYNAHYDFWKSEMPDYEVIKLGYDNLILATRIPHDLEIMRIKNYAYTDERFNIITNKYLT